MSTPLAETSAAPASSRLVARGIALTIAAAIAVIGFWLHSNDDYGRAWSWTLLSGALFGFFLQRSRFCFFCGFREFIEENDARPLLGILAALAVGTIGYAVVFGAWLPFPESGHLPPRAHIGPAGWHLIAGGFAFGVGMSLSGSCLSAHFYRLGEGSLLAPIAIISALAGFILGFNSWEFFYLHAVTEAPILWLPRTTGYAGALALQLLPVSIVAFLIWRRGNTPPSPASLQQSPAPVNRSFSHLARAVFVDRWPHWIGGVAIGALSAVVYFRATPLGVTAELGRFARHFGGKLNLVPSTLPGLDALAGCATADRAATLLTPNALFVLALIAASLASGLASGQFASERPTKARVFLAAVGGLLLGFGSMISLGCTIGTLLSGIHAFAISGWIFAAALLGGTWAGLKLRRKLGH